MPRPDPLRGSDLLDFSPRGWGRVILWTVLGTLVCIAAASYVDSFNFPSYDEPTRLRAILTNVLLPIALAVPMLLFLTIKLRELAVAQEKLARLASMDSLTSVLNRGAFTALVEGYLERLRNADGGLNGALLVVDADNFKAINDTYGHDRGDVALKLIAASIQSLLRATDVVGRIGGEEFGVFLPGASPEMAESVAERIRSNVAGAEFVNDGERQPLSVSVGGAVFEHKLAFGELFRIADQQLYAAKRQGRNSVSVAPVAAYDTMPTAAA